MEEGFGLSGTSIFKRKDVDDIQFNRDVMDDEKKWDGVSDVILGRKEWFDAWVEGEKQCKLLLFSFDLDHGINMYCTYHTVAEDQYNEIIGAPDAWLIADDDGNEDRSIDPELRPTNSARRIKALVEQVTGVCRPAATACNMVH